MQLSNDLIKDDQGGDVSLTFIKYLPFAKLYQKLRGYGGSSVKIKTLKKQKLPKTSELLLQQQIISSR